MTENEVQTSEELAAALEAITAVVTDYGDLIRQPIHHDTFDEFSGGVVRPQHALNALQDADSRVLFEYQEARLLVVAKAVDTSSGSFVLLVLGFAQEREVVIAAAYRLYASAEEVSEFAKDARRAFQTFLERYAMPFRAENRRVLFLPVLVVEATAPDEVLRALELSFEEEDGWTFFAMGRRVDEGTKLTWPFVIDMNHYKADVRAEHR